MDGDKLIQVTWHSRLAPLSPVAVAAQGNAATALALRLLKESDDVLIRFKGVGGRGLLVIQGPEELLPWVDRVVYLGRDHLAPSLLLPTNLEPSVPLSLLERSLTERYADAAPCALLLDPLSIVPMTEARPIARKSLIKWLEADL
jgi:MoxR-vWA-beta-propeller ternary system domain bpX5